MKYTDIDNKKIEINNTEVCYDSEDLRITTGWLNSFYNKKFDRFNLFVSGELLTTFKQIDKLVKGEVPEKLFKHSTIIKEFDNKQYITPQIKYATMFNENKERQSQETMKKVFEQKGNEYRLVLTIKKIYTGHGYMGVSVNCEQIQFRKKVNKPVEFEMCD